MADLGFGRSARANYLCVWAAWRCGRRGCSLGPAARAASGTKAHSGCRGAAGAARISSFVIDIFWAATDAGARLHLDFLCDGGAGHEGCKRRPRAIFGLLGAVRVPFS